MNDTRLQQLRQAPAQAQAKETVIDRVLFQMPRDHELQFAAMTALQSYVNEYDIKMQTNDVSGGRYEFRLAYAHDLSTDDCEFYKVAGLALSSSPSALSDYAMVVDLRDDRINRFKDSCKHAVQICSILCGTTCPAIPEIRTVRPDMKHFNWRIIPSEPDCLGCAAIDLSGICELQDGDITGIVGRASRETYLACAMGLPVVEIIPVDRPSTWLSKFMNPGYRVVRGFDEHTPKRISAAIQSIEAELQHIAMQPPEKQDQIFNARKQVTKYLQNVTGKYR